MQEEWDWFTDPKSWWNDPGYVYDGPDAPLNYYVSKETGRRYLPKLGGGWICTGEFGPPG